MDAVGFNVGFHFEHSNIILFNHQAIEMEAIKKSISSSVSFNVCAYGNIFCDLLPVLGPIIMRELPGCAPLGAGLRRAVTGRREP